MALPPSSPLRSVVQTGCVFVVALALPALICHSTFLTKWLRLRDAKLKPVMRASGGVQDVASGLATLNRDRPVWVLVGNSMLNTRVQDEYLEQLSGHRLYKLSFSGTKSAMWFLMLKHIVAPSEAKPKCVTVMFRDRDLTQPAVRVEDNHAMIERMKGREQPEWAKVLGDYEASLISPWTRVTNTIGESLDALLPGDKLREWARGKVQKTAFNLSAFDNTNDEGQRRDERNTLLSLDHQRKSLSTAASSEEAREAQLALAEEREKAGDQSFDPSSNKSFLPHMIALAQQHGFKLHFHRIKINPEMFNHTDEEKRELATYLTALRTYVESQGCLYTDETSVPDITASMYVDSMHIKTEPTNQQTFMKIFWRHVQPTIDSVLKGAGKSTTTAAP